MTSPSNPYAELIETLIQRTKDYEAEISRLTRDVEEAKEALKPFAGLLVNGRIESGSIVFSPEDFARIDATLTRLAGEEK